MTIQAIETRYAGCRFRSRLEARWAVFFDTAHIEWEYEPQGFELEWRLQWPKPMIKEPLHYLPDFWLPRLGLWAEVKGSLDPRETARLINAAAALSSPTGGCGGGHDMLLLGPVPPAFPRRTPYRLHMHKGDLNAVTWPAGVGCHGDLWLADDTGAPRSPDVIQQLGDDLLRGQAFPWSTPDFAWFFGAVTAARSARFEHGESGA